MKIFLWGKPDLGAGTGESGRGLTLRNRLSRQIHNAVQYPDHCEVFDAMWATFQMGAAPWLVDGHLELEVKLVAARS